MSGKLCFRGRAGLKTHYIKLWSISFKKYLYVEAALGLKRAFIEDLKIAFSVFFPLRGGRKKAFIHLYHSITVHHSCDALRNVNNP